MPIPNSMHRWWLLYIFVVSGFTGLIYESIWSHYLKLFLGHAAYAQTLVLAMFMGGMALGSWLVARQTSRWRRLLLGYVIVEAIIGIFGLIFHPMFVSASDWSFQSVIPALSSNAAVHLFKWTLAAALILPQSILLGMTFPLISGGIIRRWPERPGETLSLLYFTNSIGAAIGVLVSGFVLIEAFGLPGTIRTAGLLNLLLALCVWWIVRKSGEADAPAISTPPATTGTAQPRWFLVAAFATGAASFLYEIGWIRMLSLVLGSSTHSFELMLSAFIFGLACGGLWMRRRIDRVTDPARYLGIVMITMGGLALLTLPAYNKTFDIMQWALQTFAPTEEGYTGFNLVSQSIALLIMLPTTFCAGMTLPLLTHALMKQTGGERAIGAVYASNTLGAIIGVLLGVHVLMPMAGVKGVIMSGATIHMILGLSGLMLLVRIPLPVLLKAAGGCAAALAVVALVTQLDPLRMTSGVFRTGQAVIADDAEVLYLRDGKTATISLVKQDSTVVIATNGKPDATLEMGDGPAAADEITMVLAAALPLGMHPQPERVANIGFGSGLTAHTVLASDRVKELDNIEIEPLMVEAARLGFYPRVQRVFDDPRSRIVYDDAKTFFATSRAPYDIIISEPSNPWVSGVATLFSQEFYARIAAYLKHDGYFVQWMQVYETDAGIIASVMQALASQFPTYAMYSTDESNVLIVATRAAELPDVSDELFGSSAMRDALARVGVFSVGDLRQRRIGNNKLLDPMFQSFPVTANSDYVPYVDLNAPRARFMRKNALELVRLLTLPVPVESILSDSADREPVQPAARSSFFRDEFVRKSRLIAEALVHKDRDDIVPSVAREIALITMTSEQCRDPATREVWRRAVREIADLTSPFAPAETRMQIWDAVRASTCYREHAGLHRDWADFLAAIALRDAESIEKTGDAILANTDVWLSSEERTFAAVAVAAAKLRKGAASQARKLLVDTANGPHFHRFYELSIRQLLAVGAFTPDTAPLPEGPPVLVERLQ